MKIIDIPSESWSEFCRLFSEMNSGTLINLHFQTLDGKARELARDLPLESITLQKAECVDNVVIRAGAEKQSRIVHTISEPIELRFKPVEHGQKVLQIRADQGITYLHFHSGRFPEIFESGARTGTR